MTVATCALAALIVGLLLIGLLGIIVERKDWRYDERNPCRRYCRHCGQQQDEFMWNTDPPMFAGWENICPIKPKTKRCRHS